MVAMFQIRFTLPPTPPERHPEKEHINRSPLEVSFLFGTGEESHLWLWEYMCILELSKDPSAGLQPKSANFLSCCSMMEREELVMTQPGPILSMETLP